MYSSPPPGGEPSLGDGSPRGVAEPSSLGGDGHGGGEGMRQTRGAVGGRGTNKQKVGHAAIHWPTGVQFVSSKLVYKISGVHRPQGVQNQHNSRYQSRL